jgi:feruloyl-CoA synthase
LTSINDTPNWTPSPFELTVEQRANGVMLLRPRAELAPYPLRVTDALEHWAAKTPEATFVARRAADGAWQHVSYAQALQRVRCLAGGLAPLALSAERPLLILSGNSIEHLLLGLAAMYLGVPYCPVSPAYSQASSDLSRLRYVVDLLTPGLVAAFGSGAYGRAIEGTVPPDTLVLADEFAITGRQVLKLSDLEAQPSRAAESAHLRIGPDTVAKFLLTSGSAGQPKAVITTQRMLCSNQIMLREALPFVTEQPPVLVDWLPWHHTFGGSHNVGLVLFNGGSLYIDEGKPVPKAFGETLRNLREISPTIYFNVPKGFEILAAHLHADQALREKFYRRLQVCFFAGAGLSQHIWDALDEEARAAGRTRIPILSGLGATETSPSVTFTTPDNDRAGVIGRPAAGNLVKLAPVGGKLELRVRGPNVTPGYWRLPEQSAPAFDEEGFYCLGDAVRLVDPKDPQRGLIFDGRITEDFKLASGTWVSVGPLRVQLLAALAPLAQDVVIAGVDQDYLAVLIVPDLPACAQALAQPPREIDPVDLLNKPELHRLCLAAIKAHNQAHPGNSTRVERAVLLAEPLSLDKGEITDKGSVNQRTVLRCRELLVFDLYRDPPPAHVLTISARVQVGGEDRKRICAHP